MITEDYVNFETAKLLKEKGFNEKCDRVYMHDGKCICAPNFMEGESFVDNDDIEAVKRYDEPNWIDYIQGEYAYLCPSISLAMKWLREVHHWHIFVIPRWEDVEYMPGEWQEEITGYQYVIVSVGEVNRKNEQPIIKALTPESAYEAAIKYCLENLI